MYKPRSASVTYASYRAVPHFHLLLLSLHKIYHLLLLSLNTEFIISKCYLYKKERN